MKYRKKPVVIEAIQYNGINVQEIENFVGKKLQVELETDAAYQVGKAAPVYSIIIPTLEGDMKAMPFDYIIKGVKGEFYPCKTYIFEQTYEKVADSDIPVI